jgi:hypothetical protein
MYLYRVTWEHFVTGFSDVEDRLASDLERRSGAWGVMSFRAPARTIGRALRARILQGRARFTEYTMSSLTLFVGIDVAKETLDVAVRPTAETWQVANEMAEINTLVAQLEVMAPALVVLEATGGFEGPLLAALAVAALPVVRANPRQVRSAAHRVVGRAADQRGHRLDARYPAKRRRTGHRGGLAKYSGVGPVLSRTMLGQVPALGPGAQAGSRLGRRGPL